MFKCNQCNYPRGSDGYPVSLSLCIKKSIPQDALHQPGALGVTVGGSLACAGVQHPTPGPARCGAVGLSTEPECCVICPATDVSLFISIKKWFQNCSFSCIRQILRNETAVCCVDGGGVCETGELPWWRYGTTETIACKTGWPGDLQVSLDVTSQVVPADNAWGVRDCVPSKGFLPWPPALGAQLLRRLPGRPLSPRTDLCPDLT